MKDFEEERPAKRDWEHECKELETLVAQQAAVIEQMRGTLEHINKHTPLDYKTIRFVETAIVLQPCQEVLNRVRADAWREAAAHCECKSDSVFLIEHAQRIEQGEA